MKATGPGKAESLSAIGHANLKQITTAPKAPHIAISLRAMAAHSPCRQCAFGLRPFPPFPLIAIESKHLFSACKRSSLHRDLHSISPGPLEKAAKLPSTSLAGHQPGKQACRHNILYIYTAMELHRKLVILADAAKYDASCASSGAKGRDSLDGKGMGSVTGVGICHSYAPDGRCISLLKILLTNVCIFDCRYCINRKSSNVQRARFSVDEVVRLTLDFYRRNCIEGLFLSSGIIRSSDYTMEQLVEVARRLREEHDFRGYIHLKTIPDAAPELLARAGRHADRLRIIV
jgi:hypothetical protein